MVLVPALAERIGFLVRFPFSVASASCRSARALWTPLILSAANPGFDHPSATWAARL